MATTSSTAPPSLLMPALPSDSISLQGDSRHFISRREFEVWSKTHPSVRPPTVPNGSNANASSTSTVTTSVNGASAKKGGNMATNGENTGYRAPQHPVSHLLQSIPPRAPSRSSRSNILSYTVHLATSTRLEAYTSSNGARALLHRAEDASDKEHIDLDEQWLESEQKAQGLWKLGVSLLRANRREGDLPASVARRVELAGLTEELFSNPTPEGSVVKILSNDVVSSETVPAIQALQPLTSPDTTTLYHSTSTHAAASGSSKVGTSVAQSLIDKKFAKEKEPESGATGSNPVFADTKSPVNGTMPLPSESVFSSSIDASTSSRGVELTATPHMDYRIVRGQAMRSRAKEIFSLSILPSTSTTWCRRHRVPSCSVCLVVASTKLDKRRNVPGQGLDVGSTSGEGAPGKRALVEVIPRFLSLSAHLLKDARERFGRSMNIASGEDELETLLNSTTAEGSKDEIDITVTALWFSLLHSLVTQACLEGYLVDGWTDTSAIETLFGCGCGVWEGRGWSARVTQNATSTTSGSTRAPRSTTAMELDDDESDDEDDEDEQTEEQILEAERELEKNKLVEAAQLLFGSRDAAQAEFERSMRDRIHEFLNVPEDRTLKAHLMSLSVKFPLSKFENDMYAFLESTTRFLGKPALAKQYEASASSKPLNVADSAPDPWALTPYFARSDVLEESTLAPIVAHDSNGPKRRRTD